MVIFIVINFRIPETMTKSAQEKHLPIQKAAIFENSVASMELNAISSDVTTSTTISSDITTDDHVTVQTPTKRPLKRRIAGISLIILCSFLATVKTSLVKYLADIPTGEVVAILGAFCVCFYSALASHQGVSVVKFPRARFVILRGALAASANVCKIWSVKNMNYGDATALVFTAPLFTGVLARLFLKEKYTIAHVFSTIVGLAGVIMIAKPGFIFGGRADEADTPAWYPVIPLTSAFFIASGYCVQRNIGKSVSTIVVSFYLVVCQIIAGTIFHFASGSDSVNPGCLEPRALLVVAALLTGVMFMSLNRGLALETATTAALIRNLDTVLAYFAQVFVFGVATDAVSLGGAALVMSGTVLITLTKAFNLTCGLEF